MIEKFDFSENKGGFDYLTKASAVYSSNIEGNSIDLNSFMNYELSKEKILESFQGWNAYAKWADSYRLRRGVVKMIYSNSTS